MKKILMIVGFVLLTVGQSSFCEEKPFEADMHTMGLWHFDEGVGNIVKDAAGFGADGTFITNKEKGGVLPEWVEGKFGKALRFHGNWDVVKTKLTESLKIEGPITIEAWVKLDDPTKTAGIIAVNKSSTSKGFRLEYTVWKQYHGFSFTICDGKKSSTAYSLPMTKRLSPDTWYHVAAVYDEEKLKIFVDGKDVTEEKVDTTSVPPTKHTWPVYIGGYQESFNNSFIGVIDEVRISNVARKIVHLKEN